MSAIVNIFLQRQSNHRSPISEDIAKTLVFEDIDAANKFAKNFGEKFLHDGTESRYIAKASSVVPGGFMELLYTIDIGYGEYILGRELLDGYQIEANPAMHKALKNYNSAYALGKNGEVIELKGDNVGTRTFYTLNSDIVQQLNDAE